MAAAGGRPRRHPDLRATVEPKDKVESPETAAEVPGNLAAASAFLELNPGFEALDPKP